jgi:hypothetical protein
MFVGCNVHGSSSSLRRAHRTLRALLPVALIALIAMVSSLTACVKHYKPPAANEPHALVKLRRVYHSAPGPERATYANINDEQVYSRDESAAFDAPQTEALRIYPGPARWELSVEFHHEETRMVQEHYYEQIPYSEMESYTEYESYDCGTGGQYRSCQRGTQRSRMVTKYRNEPRQRWVNKTEHITDDRCDARYQGVFADGEVYLLQYTYVGEGQCSMQCLKQQPDATGQNPTVTPCR